MGLPGIGSNRELFNTLQSAHGLLDNRVEVATPSILDPNDNPQELFLLDLKTAAKQIHNAHWNCFLSQVPDVLKDCWALINKNKYTGIPDVDPMPCEGDHNRTYTCIEDAIEECWALTEKYKDNAEIYSQACRICETTLPESVRLDFSLDSTEQAKRVFQISREVKDLLHNNSTYLKELLTDENITTKNNKIVLLGANPKCFKIILEMLKPDYKPDGKLDPNANSGNYNTKQQYSHTLRSIIELAEKLKLTIITDNLYDMYANFFKTLNYTDPNDVKLMRSIEIVALKIHNHETCNKVLRNFLSKASKWEYLLGQKPRDPTRNEKITIESLINGAERLKNSISSAVTDYQQNKNTNSIYNNNYSSLFQYINSGHYFQMAFDLEKLASGIPDNDEFNQAMRQCVRSYFNMLFSFDEVLELVTHHGNSMLSLNLSTNNFTEMQTRKILDKCPNVERLSICGEKIQNVKQLLIDITEKYPNLKSLFISNCPQLDAEYLEPLASLKTLELNLHGCQSLTANDIQSLAGCLQSLKLSSDMKKIIDNDTISSLTKLEHLSLADSCLAGRFLSENFSFASIPPSVVSLSLEGHFWEHISGYLTKEQLDQIASRTNLRELSLTNCFDPTIQNLSSLCALTNLEKLSLNGTMQFTETSITHLPSSIKRLRLYNNKLLQIEHLHSFLTAFTELESLSLDKCSLIQDVHIKQLENDFPNVKIKYTKDAFAGL